MTRSTRHDDAFDERGLLKDGRRVRISMTMRDAALSKYTTGSDPRGPRGQQPGDLCTRNGAAGRLRMVNGELQCVPLKSQDARSVIVDGRTDNPLAGNRPGFRLLSVADRRAVRDAYQNYERGLCNAYKVRDGERLCSDCAGSGYDDDGSVCPTCDGSGVIDDDNTEDRGTRRSRFGSTNGNHSERVDNQTVRDQQTRDHRASMERLIAQRDAEDADAWRQR